MFPRLGNLILLAIFSHFFRETLAQIDERSYEELYDYYAGKLDNLPDDYSELYDYYNYYNEKEIKENENGRSSPGENLVEGSYEAPATAYNGRRDENRESQPPPERNEINEGESRGDNEKDDDNEWRRDLVYKTYREQLESYNKMIREQHAARYSTRAPSTTTTTTTTTKSRSAEEGGKLSDSECRDTDSRCERWALNGWCGLWKSITQVYCGLSCGFCEGMAAPCTDDADVASFCKTWMKNGDCESDYDYMYQRCPATCGFCDQNGLKLVKRKRR